jgi:hypothetical protein
VREKSQLEEELEGERMERQKEARRVGEMEMELASAKRELAEMK